MVYNNHHDEVHYVTALHISLWVRELSEECQKQAEANPDNKTEMELMQENSRLRKELEEAKKENLFLKKSGGILCEGNRLAAYRFIINIMMNLAHDGF